MGIDTSRWTDEYIVLIASGCHNLYKHDPAFAQALAIGYLPCAPNPDSMIETLRDAVRAWIKHGGFENRLAVVTVYATMFANGFTRRYETELP